MSLLFTRGCEYALQAILYLASRPQMTPIYQRDISEALNIPPHFLGKILQILARNRLVISQKGKSGGFVLGRAASEITLFEIVHAVDGPMFLEGCVLGFPGCSDENPCPVHTQWKTMKGELIEMLGNKTVAELSSEIDGKLESIRDL